MNKARRAAAAGAAWEIYRDTTRADAPGLLTRVRALPRMLRAVLRRRYRGLGARRVTLLIIGLAYIVSPIDAIPEMVPFVGLADDFGVAMWLLATLVAAAGEFVQWERRQARVVPGEVIA